MDRWRDEPVVRVTTVLLTGGLALVALGSAGLGSSLLVVVVLFAAAGGLSLLGRLGENALERVDRHRFYADAPLGPVVGAVVALRWLDATPGELQALGGLVGLVGMANYFLRPVYRALYRLVRRASAAG